MVVQAKFAQWSSLRSCLGILYVQVSAETASVVKKVIEIRPSTANVKPQHMSLLNEFAPSGVNANRYAPQSVTIQGIRTGMYSTFVTDLEEATQDEAAADRKFEDYINQTPVE